LCLGRELFNEIFVSVACAVDVISLRLSVLAECQFPLAYPDVIKVDILHVYLVEAVYLREFFAFLGKLDVELEAFLLFVEALIELV
jgi:hypothetical protein